MLTLGKLVDICLDETKDRSTSNRNRAIERMNDIQAMICASNDYFWLDDSYTVTTVASQQEYDFPVNYRKIKTVVVTVGTTRYPPLKEITDEELWDRMNTSSVSLNSDIPTHYKASGKKLEIFPKPSSSGNTITIKYVKRPRYMSALDYNTGSIAVTNGDETVTGTDTDWVNTSESNRPKVGSKIRIGDNWYEIASITDDTHLELTVKYQSSTESGITDYVIGDCPIIHEDFQSILWKQYCEEYYARKEQTRTMATYTQRRAEVKELMDGSSSSESTSNVFSLDAPHFINPNDYPTNLSVAP